MVNVVSKLRYGGELIIRGLDLIEISRQIFIKSIDFKTAQHMIYNNRQSADCMNGVVEQLKKLGLDISLYYTDQSFYQVEARRPNAS